jgi:thioredoxin reductase
MQKKYDAVIIGAGPAGVSCAIWLKQFGFAPLLLEASDRVGGLSARNPFFDLWTPTVAGQTGIDIARGMASQLEASGAEVWLNSPVERVTTQLKASAEQVALVDKQSVATVQLAAQLAGPLVKQSKFLTQSVEQRRQNSIFIVSVLHKGQLIDIEARAVVIAAGVKARPLQSGQDQSWPGILVGPGEKIIQQDFTGLSVALLGGGDNAFENYEYVKSRGASHAHIYARTIRAQKQFVSRVNSSDVHVGAYDVEPNSRAVKGRVYDLIIVLYGWEAQATFVEPLALKLNAKGFIATDHDTAQTSQTGVYAIGEVAQRMHPCVVTAFADGVVAAKAIEAQLAEMY